VTAPNPNTAWARALVDELARAGVEHACIAPGSRSTPLTLAVARHDTIIPHLHLDERSAAFYALGLAKRTGMPAIVVTTSGTAVANLHPAIVEARQAGVPLIALTADRPAELHGADANQTIDQTKIYGDTPLAFADLGEPKLEAQPLRNLRARADRAVATAIGPPPGPVQLNAPFAKPLGENQPRPVPENLDERAPLGWTGREDGRPLTAIDRSRPMPDEAARQALVNRIEAAQHGLIVAGPARDPHRTGPAIQKLAESTGFPVLADPLSGARFTPGAKATCVPHYDLLLRDDELAEQLEPDLVLRLGRSPTSKHANDYLERHAPSEQIAIGDGSVPKDHRAIASQSIRADPARLVDAIGDELTPDEAKRWRSAWNEPAQRVRQMLDDEHDSAFEGTLLAEAARAVPDGGQLFVSNSMPVRDLDTFAQPRDAPVYAHGNRGASGIDGIVSTALGLAQAHEGPTLAVLGDLALIHDQNGLQQLTRKQHDIVFLVVNNDGGGIFHMLPVRENEHFDPYFTTPHGLDLGAASNVHGLDHETVAPDSVPGRLDAALEDACGQILEVRTDRETNRARHADVEARVLEALQGDSP